MSITVTVDNASSGQQVERISRNNGEVTGTITFDSSYTEGGESLSDLVDHFYTTNSTSHSPLRALEMQMPGGYTAVLDVSTPGSEVVKVFDSNVPPIVHEEAFDAAEDTATLKYPAAHIEYVASEAAPFQPIFGGVTPTAGMVAIAMGYDTTTGVHTKGTQPVLTFYAADGIALTYGAAGAFATGMVCSYVTQAWKDVSDNMESCKLDMDGSGVTAATPSGYWNPSSATWASDVLDLGTDVCAVTSHTWINGATVTVPITVMGVSGTCTAGTDIGIDMVKAGSAEIRYLAGDVTEADGDTIYVQYIKHPGSTTSSGGFLGERFRNTGIADASDSMLFTGNPLMYGTCGQIPTVATAKAHELVAEFDTVAAGQCHWTSPLLRANSSGTPTIVTEAATNTNTEPAWIEGAIGEIETQAIEVPGADYSGLGAIRFRAVGYTRA